jgi:hypothetical protein
MLHTDLIAPIPELLCRQAAARGNKCAFRDAQTAVTYAELYDRTGTRHGFLRHSDTGACSPHHRSER